MTVALLPCILLQQWRYLLVAVALALVSILLSWSRRSNRYTSAGLHLPPGPQKLPLLGNLHQIGALPHRSLWALARQHGPVMLLRLGSVPTVVVSSPEAAREVMRTHDAHCCSRPAMPGARRLTYGFRDVAFAPYGDHVREMRRLFILELQRGPGIGLIYDSEEAKPVKLLKYYLRVSNTC